LKGALCKHCKFININQLRIHEERCNRAKLSLRQSSDTPSRPQQRKQDQISKSLELSSPFRCASVPNPPKTLETPEVRPVITTKHKRRRRSSRAVILKEDFQKINLQELKKPIGRPAVIHQSSNSPEKEKYRPIKQDPEDELEMCVDDYDEVPFTFDDGYQAEASQSSDATSDGPADSLIIPKLQLNLSALVKQIQVAQNLIGNQNATEALEKLQFVENSLLQASLDQKKRDQLTNRALVTRLSFSKLSPDANKFRKKKTESPLRRLSIDGISQRRRSESIPDFSEQKHIIDESQYQEIQIRVDQTSILNNSSANNAQNVRQPRRSATVAVVETTAPPTRVTFQSSEKTSHSATDLRSHNIQIRETPGKSKLSGRNRHTHASNPCDDIDSQMTSSDSRFLTFVLQHDEKLLKYGHILDILEWLVNHPETTIMDMETFLFTYRIAISPTLLFNTLKVLYQFSYNPIRAKQIITMISLWIRLFYVIDFYYDESLSASLWAFIQNYFPSKHKKLRKYSGSWQNLHWDYIRREHESFQLPLSIPRAINILGDDPKTIAEQLTLIEWEYFKCFDIFHCICSEKPTSKQTEMIADQFNRISGWVASTILSEIRSKKRAACISFFISVAKCLLELKNFNGIMEIVSGLNSTPIGRLKKTWKILEKHDERQYQKFKNLNSLMSPINSFKDYRTVVSQVQPPLIPFFAVISRDVTLINVGNSTFINKLINFEKCGILWRLCSDVLHMQHEGYTAIQPLPMLNSYFTHVPIPDEQELYDISITLEPIAVEIA